MARIAWSCKASTAMALALLISACSQGNRQGNAAAAAASRGPATVGYVVVRAGSAPIEAQLPARVSAYQVSDVRPQVTGVILRRLFREGSVVRQGQTLYQIDPSLYQAAAGQAGANLESARASAEAAHQLAARYKPLVDVEAVAKQDYTNAVSQARQADAAIAQNAAALRSASINLRFTRVPAPITGRVGLSNFTEGALVTSGQAEALTTIARLDPIYVDIQQSAADLLALRQALGHSGIIPTTAQVHLKLPDGSVYGFTGTLEFSEVIVDQGTGSVTVRARFPNPQSVLLPGMFVRAQFAQAVNTSAILVPQQAVSRDPKGSATVWIVDPGNRAVLRTIVADRVQGPYWVVTEGLRPGEKIITQGTLNLAPGARVNPVPASSPQRVQAPPAKALAAASLHSSGR